MGDNKRKPDIRFQGFTDDWEQRKVFDVAEVVGGGTPSTTNPDYWDGDINWYAPAEIGEKIYVDSSERKITKLGLEKSSAKILPAHKTVLFTSRAGIGNTAILLTPAATNQGFQSMVLHDDINPYFVFSMTDMIKGKAERVASGSTFAEISGKMLGNLEFMFPSKDEQDKIGCYFESFDNLITLQQRKCDKLVNVKKSMLEKMFPREGAKVPEIRFEGFTDDWEQRKLGEIAKTTIGEFVIKTKQDDSYPYPVFNGGSSNTGFYNEFNNEGNKILVSARGANAGFVNIIKTRYWAGNSCYSIDLINKTEFDTDFIYQEMKRNQSRFTDNQQAANIPSVSKSDVEKLIIEVPEYAEQVKIANYFNNLDNLITLQQRKLEKLKNIKKSMLEKMFV